jgi:hypothetical protein
MEIPKVYEPQAVEDKWYQFWLDQKCFVADAQSPKPAFSIVIPPPNVTGMLHMGHRRREREHHRSQPAGARGLDGIRSYQGGLTHIHHDV